MRNLTDEEYATLKEYAQSQGMQLYGYQTIGNGVTLNNSITGGVYATSIQGLREAIHYACRLYSTNPYN